MPHIKWETTGTDLALIKQITERAAKLFTNRDPKNIEMDVTACHLNGLPLNLQALLDSPDHHFTHDLAGIRDLIDHETGKLPGYFLPKCNRAPVPESNCRGPAV